jgi:serine protease Do
MAGSSFSRYLLASSAALGMLLSSWGGAARVLAQEPAAEDAVREIESALVEVVAKAERSVVAIARIRKDDAAPMVVDGSRFAEVWTLPPANPTSPDYVPQEFGAGVVVDKRGLILTTLHVLGEIAGSEYVVWIGRRPYSAKVKAADPWLDVAVLEIAADDLIPIELGDARSLKKGQIAVTLGNPRGIARDGEPSAAWGMIANLSRQAPPNPGSRARGGRETLHHYGTLIQLDTRSPLGSSGGAVINLKGELIGLATTLTSLPEQHEEAGFAIPVDDDFKKALDMLKAGRLPAYGFLGIAPQSLSLVDRQAGKQGVMAEVLPGTPAANAGLRPGDIIVEVNGVPVRDELHLIRLVSALPAEEEIALRVEREGRGRPMETLRAVLSKKYQESGRESYATERDPAWRGLTVEYATASPTFPDLIRHIDPQGCIAALEVERDSPAWRAGLRAGQFITHVGGARVATPKEFHERVAPLANDVILRVTSSPDGELVRTISAP